ncbi:MAG: hypothetical protein IPK82_23095 [Polyangiaceae bacterium]|nr:hypothetical protein [Polyangiaceae bacterium]
MALIDLPSMVLLMVCQFFLTIPNAKATRRSNQSLSLAAVIAKRHVTCQTYAFCHRWHARLNARSQNENRKPKSRKPKTEKPKTEKPKTENRKTENRKPKIENQKNRIPKNRKTEKPKFEEKTEA